MEARRWRSSGFGSRWTFDCHPSAANATTQWFSAAPQLSSMSRASGSVWGRCRSGSEYRCKLCSPTRHCHGCELCTDGARTASDSADRMVSASGKCALIGYTFGGRLHVISTVAGRASACAEHKDPGLEDLGTRRVSGGPDWDRTSDLPRVRHFAAQGISVSAGHSAADGPGRARWSICSESLALFWPYEAARDGRCIQVTHLSSGANAGGYGA